MKHIDEWITHPYSKNEGERYAKFVFWYFRYPAWAHMEFHQWMKQFQLFCTYEGIRYRVTGASRMGDIWLTTNFSKETGYEKRVDVEQCSEWSDKPIPDTFQPLKPPEFHYVDVKEKPNDTTH